MKKLGLLVTPLMAISLLASCGSKPGPTPEEDVTFSADTTVTLDESKTTTNITLDWTPSDHSIECADFTFTLLNQKSIEANIVSGEVGSRPLNLTITFSSVLNQDDIGDLKFHYNDKTTKKEGEGKAEGINVKLPEPTNYTITYDYDGGQGSTEPSSYTIEDKVTLPTPTTLKTGYEEFDGWYFDEGRTQPAGTGWNAGEQQGAKYLYAKYKTLKNYTITYNMPDGASKGDNPDSYTVESETITLTNATKKGYTFDGWHIDSTDGKVITTIPKGSAGDLDLYTSETLATYTITYHLDGGSVTTDNPTSYTIEDKITLNAPTQDGYVFKGWYLAPNEVNPLGGNGWEPGTIYGNIDLYADWHVADKTLDADYNWAQISTISGNKEASKYFDVGETKKVQLKHQDLDSDGVIDANEVYQTVRIIGFNHDNDSNDDPIGITFEFANLISDASGYSLAVQWFDTEQLKESANHYFDISSVRRSLFDSKIPPTFNWAEKGATDWSETYTTNDTVLSMLPDGTEDLDNLVAVLKEPAKYVALCGLGTETWIDTPLYDKLFLLSPREMGLDDARQEKPEHTFTYAYYKGHTSDSDSIRNKHPANNTEAHITTSRIPKGEGQIYQGDVYNWAGYNYAVSSDGGGAYWLRSPSTSVSSGAWSVGGGGRLNYGSNVCNCAFAVAPAFCI